MHLYFGSMMDHHLHGVGAPGGVRVGKSSNGRALSPVSPVVGALGILHVVHTIIGHHQGALELILVGGCAVAGNAMPENETRTHESPILARKSGE